MKKIIILISFPLAFVLCAKSEFMQIDMCADGGGCWDHVEKKCRKIEVDAQFLCHRNKISRLMHKNHKRVEIHGAMVGDDYVYRLIRNKNSKMKMYASVTKLKSDDVLSSWIFSLKKNEDIAGMTSFSCSMKGSRDYIIGVIDKNTVVRKGSFPAIRAVRISTSSGLISRVKNIKEVKCAWTPGGDEPFPTFIND